MLQRKIWGGRRMGQTTIRLTMAQALVRYLCSQYTEIDGQ
jgi:hypothetical protein